MRNNADDVREKLKYISFADAQILYAILEAGDAHVVIQDWRERKIHLFFRDVVLFKSFQFGGDILSHHIHSDSEEITEAVHVIEQNSGTAPKHNELVHMSFENDAPLMIIVFNSLQVETEDW